MGKDANEESRSGSLESALNRRIDEPEEAGSSPASGNAEDVQASGSAPNPIESLFEPSEAVPAAQPTEDFPAAQPSVPPVRHTLPRRFLRRATNRRISPMRSSVIREKTCPHT